MPKKRSTGSKRSTTWRDPDDAPDLTKEWFQRASLYHGKKLIRRGRPPGPVPKRPVTMRLDTDIIAHFQEGGPGWQSRINAALRRALMSKTSLRHAYRLAAKRESQPEPRPPTSTAPKPRAGREK